MRVDPKVMRVSRGSAIALVLALVITSSLYIIIIQSVPPTTTTASSMSTQTQITSTSTSTTELGGNWTTYHGNNARTGLDSTSEPATPEFGWSSPALDGSMYAEPLVLRNEVVVATENDSVYSLDARTGSILWRTHLGNPVNGSTLPCGDINPTGITGTPVIDPTTQTIYVVAFLAPPPLRHVLFAIDLQNGTIRFERSADAPRSSPDVQQQRAALTLANGVVYVPYGGLAGDCGQYVGRVVGINANGTAGMFTYQVPTQREGGIWAPSGAAADSSGNLYVATGNAASDSSFDFGNSVVRLSPKLVEGDYFAPANWAQLSQNDTDLGSVGPTIVGNGLIFQVGKEGVGYILRAGALGGVAGQLHSGKVCGGAYGGTAYAQSTLFVPCTDGLVALRLNGTSFTRVWQSKSFDAGPPIVAGGMVWVVDTSTGTIFALSAADGHEVASFALGSVTHFCGPASGGGRIFVAAGKSVEAIFV